MLRVLRPVKPCFHNLARIAHTNVPTPISPLNLKKKKQQGSWGIVVTLTSPNRTNNAPHANAS